MTDLASFAARQGGVFSRVQAVGSGCRERELKTRTGARGDWTTVRRGVYVDRGVWEAADEDQRYRLRIHAAALTAERDAVVSHGSAAALWGMPLRPRWRELVHLTRSDVRGGRVEGGVSHHRAHLPPGAVVRVGGLRATTPARTALDIAREHGYEDGVVAADAACRAGVGIDELLAHLALMSCWPGITAARRAVEVADGGAESVGESLTRLLVLELGLGRPETQAELTDGRRRARVDLRLRRHLVEFDGRVKYLRSAAGGVADRSADQVVWEEKRREDWLRGLDGGYGVSRVTWDDLFGRARAATSARLARDIRESDRRYGDRT